MSRDERAGDGYSPEDGTGPAGPKIGPAKADGSGRERTEPVAAGVIGVGSMGQHHARVYAELPGVELTGVADADPDRAAAVAARHGTRALSIDALLETVAVVSIAVPTAHHHGIARKCIEQGVDVLVEKPFVADPEAGRALTALAAERGVVLQVGHIERFNPAVRAAREVLDGQEVIAVDARRLGAPREREIGDDAVMDLMIHDIDVLLSLVESEIDLVNAVGARGNRYIDAQLRFANGVAASLTASRVTQKKIRELSITTEESLITVDYINQLVEVHRQSLPEYVEGNGGVRYRHEEVVERPMVESGEELRTELAAFVESATAGTEPVVTGEDGVRALEVARWITDLAAGERRTLEVDSQ
jgi:predicted dehydrogenase